MFGGVYVCFGCVFFKDKSITVEFAIMQILALILVR